MDNIEYVEEERKEFIANGLLSLDERMSEEERRDKVFEKLESEGYELGDKSNLVINYDLADDGVNINFEVNRATKEIVPYKVEMENLYSSKFVLDPNMDELVQKRMIFTMMQKDGIEIDPSADYEIFYEESENFDKDRTVLFTVCKYNRVKVDDNSSKLDGSLQRDDDISSSDIFFEEEIEREEIFSGTFILDGLRMSEEEQREKIMKMMKDAGVVVEEGAKIEIGYEGADDFEDGMSTKFVVIKETSKKVPYKNVSEKVYSGEYILDNLRITPEEQREKIFNMMRADGISILDEAELDIRYDGANDYEDGMSTRFDVYRRRKVRIDDDENLISLDNEKNNSKLASEIVEDEEVVMDEIVSGMLDLNDLNSQEEIDNKVFEILSLSGIDVENIGEVNISYGNRTDDNKLPFTVSKVFVEKVKYEVNKRLIGVGYKREKEDIFAAVQRNQGLDIRLNPDYEIIYGPISESGMEYSLIKTNKKRLESEIVKNDYNETRVSNLEVANDVEEEANRQLDKLGKSMDIIDEVTSENGQVDEILNILDSLENNTADIVGMTSEYEELFADINSKIKFIRKNLRQAEKDYEISFNRMKELSREELEKFENSGLLSDDEILEIREEYAREKLEADEMARCAMMAVEQAKKQLTALMRRKNKLEKDILKAEALGLSVEEYRDLVDAVGKNEVMNAILANRGLSDIIEKPANERTASEKQLLLEAKEEVISKIASEQKKNASSNVSPLEMIDALYSTDSKAIIDGEAMDVKVKEEELKSMEDNSLALPEKVVSNNSTLNNNYVPGVPPEDMVEVHAVKAAPEVIEDVSKKKRRRRRRKNKNSLDDNLSANVTSSINSNPVLEKIVIYVDLDNNQNYVKKNVFNRFNLRIKDKATTIQNAVCHKLDLEDLDYIIGNANNDYSPYEIEYREVHLGKLDVDERETAEDIPIEIINLYRDANNKESKYAPGTVLDRFGIVPKKEPLQIEGEDCYKLSDEDEENIKDVVNKSTNPKLKLVYKDVELDKDKDRDDEHSLVPSSDEAENNNTDTIEEAVEEEKPLNVVITLYKDLNNNNQIYAGINVLNRFGIVPTTTKEIINGEECFQISPDTDRMINYVAGISTNPKYTIKYENVRIKKKEVPHVETILDKLTTGLEIKAKDAKRYKASNIRVTDNFKNELKSGNVLYNIVHLVPATVKATTSFLKKMAGSLMSRGRAKTVMTELQRRLSEDLSEEELDVLFEEYRGSQLKTDMNSQINDLILQRLREHGLKKAANLNDNIKNSYTHVFALLGEIKVIDQKLEDNDLDQAMRQSLKDERAKLIDVAATFVKNILVNRRDANNLLSGGVHGLEEDFKAVSTKLSYVGMRFAKTSDFDNELQHKLGDYGSKLNKALSDGNNEEILDNFMGLESCYYENTDVARSVFGKRSVGSKYYTPLAEQFDYRDDPFIRDFITTFVFANAASSAINASLVHHFKAEELLRKQNSDATNINTANDSIMDYVHQTAADIQSKRGTFQDGMQQQAHQDVLTSANSIERASLDMSNWSFTDAYRAADKAGHSFFNSFNQEVTTQINDITARYGSGAINQVEALQQMAKVADNAQNTLVNVSGECANILRTYSETHPQFDLSAIQDSLDYVVAHPDAISNMNQAMVDVTNLAGGLAGVAINHVEALSSLPSDMASTLVCAASAAGLALHVSKSMTASYGKKGVYGNEITEMMDDYLSDLNDEDEKSITR